MAKSTAAEAKSESSPGDNLRVVRETIESVVIAFILAFLFKTFEAEMFVIPTGSMAPTLLGRNKDVRCPKCGFRYHGSASREVNQNTNELIQGNEVTETTCPMCRYPLDVNPADNPGDWKIQSYNGDRIVVGKFVFDLAEPKRWDVTVFKYPHDAKINYIKRMVGLPNEELQVDDNGDIYTKHEGEANFQIQRKPPDKVRAVLQDVYDNDYVVDSLIDAGWPARWQDWSAAPRAGGWQNATATDYKGPDRKVFEIDGSLPGESWLRYRHFTPDANVWRAFDAQLPLPPARADLIRDFYAYNASKPTEPQPPENNVNPVRDLAVECDVETSASQGEFVLELVKWDRKFQCRFDLKSNEAKLSISGLDNYHPVASAALSGKHRVMLANVDCQLLVWVDEKLLNFDPADTSYVPFQAPGGSLPPASPGNVDVVTDYSPVGVASVGAALRVEHLRICRDVYYTHLNAFTHESIGADQFWMMGDNSPASADSRFFGTVDRSLLTGKALFIYWPHSFDHTSPDGGVYFPFFPNFARMHRVR